MKPRVGKRTRRDAEPVRRLALEEPISELAPQDQDKFEPLPTVEDVAGIIGCHEETVHH